MIVDEVGTAMLQISSAIKQVGEPAAVRQRREALVVLLLLSPALLGLAITHLPSNTSKKR